jgi:hypothetical protein
LPVSHRHFLRTKRRPCHGGKRTTTPPLRPPTDDCPKFHIPFATTPLNSSDDFRFSRNSWFPLFRSHAEERTDALEIDHHALPVLLLLLRSPIIITVTVTAGNDGEAEAEASEPRLARPVAGIDHSAAQHCARLLGGSPDLLLRLLLFSADAVPSRQSAAASAEHQRPAHGSLVVVAAARRKQQLQQQQQQQQQQDWQRQRR